MEKWRNEDVDALDYEEQQNRDGNGDLNVDKKYAGKYSKSCE